MTGRVRNLKALEMMVATLQRNEDREGNDYDFGGTSQYLDKKDEQNLVASLIDNRTGRVRFLDEAYHCLGKWGDQICEFYVDEIYHAGKRLSIWLRHIWLRGNRSTNIDRGGWANIDEVIQDEECWMDVHKELVRQGHKHREDPKFAICYDKEVMKTQPSSDELMYYRTWLIALIIDNELWNWGRNKKRMEFTGARLHPDMSEKQYAALVKTLVKPLRVDSVETAKTFSYADWVRPLAVRCVSGHSNGAVDLELTGIPITEKVMDAVGGAWRITSRHNLNSAARFATRRPATEARRHTFCCICPMGLALQIDIHTQVRERGRKRNGNLCAHIHSQRDGSPCDNLDICYEVIKAHEMMWNIFLWAYTTMNVNEFLTPFIAVNEDGYRKLRPNQGAGERSLISARVRSLLSNALGIRKYRYVSYRDMPKERLVDGIYHICLEGLYEGQQRRDRLDPELMYLATQTGLHLGMSTRNGAIES